MSLKIIALGISIAAGSYHLPSAQADNRIFQAYLLPESKTDVRHRFVLAENQMVLVEEISELACMVDMGIDVEANLVLIGELRDLYKQVHIGLQDGDESLGLYHPEKNSRVIRSLRAVEPVWATFDTALDAVLTQGTVPADSRTTLYEGDAAVLDTLHTMAAAVRAAYANPNELMMTEALTLELLERQKLLMEKIVKDVCLIALDWNADSFRTKLDSDAALFEKSHNAILNGLPAMGIRPAPTPEIAKTLTAMWDTWTAKSTVVETVRAGQPVNRDALAYFARANLDLLKAFDEVIKLYENL